MRVLIIDNYDSFTYNLMHYVQPLVNEVKVVKNDAISVQEAAEFSHIIISPGPGLPEAAGITMSLIKELHQSIPILGICLGCQAMAEFFGGRLFNQNKVAHGVSEKVVKTGQPSAILADMPETFEVGLYHSWAIEESSLPADFILSARSISGVVMAIEHKVYPLAGVQFHPESIMTQGGSSILRNWLEHSKARSSEVFNHP